MIESSAVLRHVLGSIRKEKLMDTQTVIAVCELLLVVIGIVSLARKDECRTALEMKKPVAPAR